MCMQKLEEAEACKQEGNRLYAAGNLEEAVVPANSCARQTLL